MDEGISNRPEANASRDVANTRKRSFTEGMYCPSLLDYKMGLHPAHVDSFAY